MSSKKRRKTGIQSRDKNFCSHCQHWDDSCEESIVLTDSRLTTLYDSDTSCPTDERPQHRINGFAIHDSDHRFCWFDTKPIEDGFQLFLCGFVEPIVSETDIEADKRSETGISVQMIGPLQEWWFAGFDGGQQLIIGVESEFASYILCEPNKWFRDLYQKYIQKMFLTKLIIECLLENPDLSYEDLVLSLEDSEQDFNEELFIQFGPFIIEQIKSFDSAADEDETKLSDTIAIRALVQLSGVSTKPKHLPTVPSRLVSHMRPIARIDSRRAANSDTLTCSTPLVTQFFDSVFKEVIECETSDSKHFNKSNISCNNNISELLLNESNRRIHWIGNSVYEDIYSRTVYYSGVRVGELLYSLRDFVVFRETEHFLKLGRIMFMFSTSDKQKLCHIHYFCYGNETILCETAPDFLVFMTNQCADIAIDKLIDKIDVQLSDKFDIIADNVKTGRYFCNKYFVRKSGRLEDLPKEVFNKDVKCVNCLMKDKNEKQKIPQLEEIIDETGQSSLQSFKKMVYKNQTYFVGNCVLFSGLSIDLNDYNYDKNVDDMSEEDYDQRLYPERYRKAFTDYIKGLNNDLPKPLNIGFITKIFKQLDEPNEETKLTINIFLRPQNVVQDYQEFLNCDLNLVFWSDRQITIGFDSLRSVCKVIYSTESPKTDFYIKTKLFYFNQCYDFENKTTFTPNEDIIKMFSVQNNSDIFTESKTKLNILDLFAGCGGLSLGFHRLGLVSKLWAIEKDCSALKSFKSNFPNAMVFEEDVNHIMDLLLKGLICDKNCQKLPQKGDIDLILGGPPCQGFSGMNRFSSRHYSLFKNSLVVSFLSFIDYFRPKYLLFENVRNFALFKSSMILKLMLSCLTRMGYQCQFAILQAGAYGLPQTRRRTVIIGAATGHPLPLFPEPTHVFSKRQCQLSLTIDNKRYLALSNKSCAQFRTLTVGDAINDLPELTEDYATDCVRQYRQLTHISHFQQILRTDCENSCLYDHYCKELSELCRLRIENIPKRLGSDWRDLPNISITLTDGTVVEKLEYLFNDLKNGKSKSGDRRGVCRCAQGDQCNGSETRQENTLIPWCLVHTANRQYQWSGLYGRLAMNGFFATTVTNPEPISKQGRVLHPNQNRIISIRESARSQGFPDHFVFNGSVNDKYRQIGNAVPIPLSIALAKQFYSVINL